MQHGLLPIFRVTLGGTHHCGLGSGLLVHPPLPVLLPGSYSRSFGPLAVWPQQEATGFCKAANGGDRGLEVGAVGGRGFRPLCWLGCLVHDWWSSLESHLLRGSCHAGKGEE